MNDKECGDLFGINPQGYKLWYQGIPVSPKLLSKDELERYRRTHEGRDLLQDEVDTLFKHIATQEKTLTTAVKSVKILTALLIVSVSISIMMIIF